MAHITLNRDAGLSHRLFSWLNTMGQSIGTALMANAAAEARLREVSRLQAKTDAELAELGISRDRIVHHVFRDIYMV